MLILCTASYFIVEHPGLKCLAVNWIRFSLNNCSVIYTVTLYYVLQQNSPEFWHTQNSVYWGILRPIHTYSALLRHIHAYSGIFITLCNSRIFTTLLYPLPDIFRTLFQTLWNFDQAYSEPCRSQNSSFRHYWAIFRHIKNIA